MNVRRFTVAGGELAPVPLARDEVHLWSVGLDGLGESLPRYEGLLAPGEKTRASRFAFEEHRRRFVVAHGLLRQILSHYTGRSAETLKFSHNACGKPLLDDGPSFNLAHSQDRAVIAVTAKRPIGVDLEKIKPLDNLMDVARGFLSEGEFGHFLALPESDRARAFYVYWTCKEALLKAEGCGLSVPLADLEIELGADLTPAGFRLPSQLGVSGGWLVSCRMRGGYQASIACL